MRGIGKFVLWVLDHFPFLACLAFGLSAGVQGHTELAVGFFILGSVFGVSGQVGDIRRELAAARDRDNRHDQTEG